jgi:hypothetical protein
MNEESAMIKRICLMRIKKGRTAAPGHRSFLQGWYTPSQNETGRNLRVLSSIARKARGGARSYLGVLVVRTLDNVYRAYGEQNQESVSMFIRLIMYYWVL